MDINSQKVEFGNLFLPLRARARKFFLILNSITTKPFTLGKLKR